MNRSIRMSGVLLATAVTVTGCAVQDRENTRPPVFGTPAATSAPVPGTSPDPPALPQGQIRSGDTHALQTPSPVPSTVPPKASPTTPSVTPSKAPPVVTAPPARPIPAPGTPKPAPTTRAAQPGKQVTSAPQTPVGNTMRIGTWAHGYVTAYGSQTSVDACNMVEWAPLWFAGHDYCGYRFWADLTVGQTLTLSGKNAGTYRVIDRYYLASQEGKMPRFTDAVDLVLQTCKGSGTQLVLAQKVA